MNVACPPHHPSCKASHVSLVYLCEQCGYTEAKSDAHEWRKCALHPDVNPETMWGCPDCLSALRKEVGMWLCWNDIARQRGVAAADYEMSANMGWARPEKQP